MSTETYLEQLEQQHAAETAEVQELQKFWHHTFPFRQWLCLPEERRFRFWVRTYGLRLMKHAVTITKDNCAGSWSVTRLGKYASSVARNIHHAQVQNQQRATVRTNEGTVRVMEGPLAGWEVWHEPGDDVQALIRVLEAAPGVDSEG